MERKMAFAPERAHLASHSWAIFVSGLQTVQAALWTTFGQLSWAGFVRCYPRLSWFPRCTNRHVGDWIWFCQDPRLSRLLSASTGLQTWQLFHVNLQLGLLFCYQIFSFSAYLDQLSPWDPHKEATRRRCSEVADPQKKCAPLLSDLPVTPSECTFMSSLAFQTKSKKLRQGQF